jgi:hypothetical protein
MELYLHILYTPDGVEAQGDLTLWSYKINTHFCTKPSNAGRKPWRPVGLAHGRQMMMMMMMIHICGAKWTTIYVNSTVDLWIYVEYFEYISNTTPKVLCVWSECHIPLCVSADRQTDRQTDRHTWSCETSELGQREHNLNTLLDEKNWLTN